MSDEPSSSSYSRYIDQLEQNLRGLVTKLSNERDVLQRWKDEQLTVESWWKEIDTFVRKSTDVRLGDSVANAALKMLRERDAIRAIADKLADAVATLLRCQGTIECLGEWEVQDMNRTLRKTERLRIDAINGKADAALAAYRAATTESPHMHPPDIESLAQTLSEVVHLNYGGTGPPWLSLTPEQRENWRNLARSSSNPLLHWALEKYHAEVASRPLHNVHRRSLDDTWRQVITFAGGNPTDLVGPPHDDLSPTSSQDLWLPIDSAPKDGSPILVNAGAEITTARWRPTPSQANGYWALCIYGDFASSDEVVPDPTHWQPLPPCKETGDVTPTPTGVPTPEGGSSLSILGLALASLGALRAKFRA